MSYVQRDFSEIKTKVLSVREKADGYWYIGAGRSIADGPYRYPQQLLTVASDLLATEPHWRIEVFDAAGNFVISYNSEQVAASDLELLGARRRWQCLDVSPVVNMLQAG